MLAGTNEKNPGMSVGGQKKHKTQEQHDSCALRDIDHIPREQEHMMGHIKWAQEIAHVLGRQTNSNKEREDLEHEKE